MLQFYSQPTIHTADCKAILLTCENDQAFFNTADGKRVNVGAMTCSSGTSNADDIAAAVWAFTSRTMTESVNASCISGSPIIEAEIITETIEAEISNINYMEAEIVCK